MSYLLDTNVISETTKQKPNRNLMQWLEKIPNDELYISVLTISEIKQGIERLEAGKKRNELTVWFEHAFFEWFGSNVLDIDRAVTEKWGHINATQKKSLSAIDALIGATAISHNLKLVTRNEKDFAIPGLEIINPFS